jgi:rhodanese-related sulfurtransferase
MESLLLYRAAALVTLGVIAGAIHSAARPISLGLQAPAPYVGPKPVVPEKPVTGTPDGTSAANGSNAAALPVAPPTPPTAAAEDPLAALSITLAEAKAFYDQGFMFLDSRYLDEYEKGHVQGALLLNTDTFATPGGGEVIQMLDREAPIVVYCNGGMCDASKNLVRLLQQSGYMGGRIFHDGYPEWVKAGYPTATGKPPVGGG